MPKNRLPEMIKDMNIDVEQGFHEYMSNQASNDLQILWEDESVPDSVKRKAMIELFGAGFYHAINWVLGNVDLGGE